MAQFKTISIIAREIDNDFGREVGYCIWLGSDNVWRSGVVRVTRRQLGHGALGLASTPEKAAQIADELNSDQKLAQSTTTVVDHSRTDTLRGIADTIWEVMRKEQKLSDGARAELGKIVADIEDMIGDKR